MLVVKPEPRTATRFRAECPFCPADERGSRERSFPHVIGGRVLVGGTDRVGHTRTTQLDEGDGVPSYLLHTEQRKAS